MVGSGKERRQLRMMAFSIHRLVIDCYEQQLANRKNWKSPTPCSPKPLGAQAPLPLLQAP
jgi:hypothetical protein